MVFICALRDRINNSVKKLKSCSIDSYKVNKDFGCLCQRELEQTVKRAISTVFQLECTSWSCRRLIRLSIRTSDLVIRASCWDFGYFQSSSLYWKENSPQTFSIVCFVDNNKMWLHNSYQSQAIVIQKDGKPLYRRRKSSINLLLVARMISITDDLTVL